MQKRIEVESISREDLRSLIVDAVRDVLELDADRVQDYKDLLLMQQGVLDAHAAGRILGVSARTIKERYVPMGLQVYRPGQAPLFLTEDVVAFVKQHPA